MKNRKNNNFSVTRNRATRRAQRDTFVNGGNISSNGKDRKYFKYEKTVRISFIRGRDREDY